MTEALCLRVDLRILTLLQELSRRQEEAAARPRPCMEQESFCTFYRQTARGLKGYLCRLCGDGALAEDLLQEAYLRLLQSPLDELQESQRIAYLYRIAANLSADHWRRRQRELKRDELQIRLGPATPFTSGTLCPGERSLMARDVHSVLEELPPRDRTLLWMAYAEGFEHREIALALGLRERSVRVLLFRARRRMAQLLQERGLCTEDPA